MLKRLAFAAIAVALASGAGILPWLAGAAPAAASAASTSDEFSLTSPEATVAVFDLKDMVQVEIGGVLTPVMRFTMNGATLRGMTLDQACRSSYAIESSVAASDTATLSGSAQVDVTTLSFTYGGTTYTLTPGDAVPPGLFPLTGTVTSVSMLGVNLTAHTAQLTGFSTKVVAC